MNFMFKKLNIALFFLSAVALTNCVDIPDYSDTPEIDYNGIDQNTEVDETSGKKVRENVIITINFRDGDGDLGEEIDQRDTLKYGEWGSYELTTARKNKDGSWSESILAEDKYKWIPVLKPDGNPGPINGKLDLNTSFLYGNSSVPVTVKFKVRIRDRALRVSNMIETDTISVPSYQ